MAFRKKIPKPQGVKPGLVDRLCMRFEPANRFRYWWLGKLSLTRSMFRVAAAVQTLIILISVLICGYVFAAFYTNSGEFVISVDQKMADSGFLLSDTTDFTERLLTLRGSAVIDADNINITDIDRNVMWVDGNHNGVNYIAYTFYLKNDTGKTHNYQYQFAIQHITKNVDKATWMMVFFTPDVTEDKSPELSIYAALDADGTAERQYSLFDFPFVEYNSKENIQMERLSAENPGKVTTDVMDYLEIADISQIRQLNAIPFAADDMVCSGIRENMEDQQIDKYTVVIWLEGEDPECVDEIRGGELETAFKFTY